MEKFSDFFNGVINNQNQQGVSASDSNSYNNDTNNIYNNIDIYEEIPQTFPIEDYYLISNEIIWSAIKEYSTLYNSLAIPYEFIAYYFTKLAQYKDLQGKYLKKFIILFHHKKNNVSNSISIFSKANPNNTNIKYQKTNSALNRSAYYLVVSNSLIQNEILYSENIDNHLKSAISQIRNIAKQIEVSAKEENLKFNYIEFLKNFSISNTEEQPRVNVAPDPYNRPKRKKRRIAPPKQEREATITKFVLPSLSTGKIYPKSFTHSRIDSAYFTPKFVEVDRSYTIVRKYKFVRVKYTDGFEAKRKSLFEVKKSSFDLF